MEHCRYINIGLEKIVSLDSQDQAASGIEFLCNNEHWVTEALGHWRTHTFDLLKEDTGLNLPLTHEQWSSLEQDKKDILHTIISSFQHGLDRDISNFKLYDYKECIERNIKFVAPIPLDTHKLSEVDLDKLELPIDILQYAKKGNVLFYLHQQFESFLNDYKDVDWLNSFASKFGLNKNNFIVASANLRWPELVNEHIHSNPNNILLFTPEIFNGCFEKLWFVQRGIHHIWKKEDHYINFYKYLYSRINGIRYRKKFLILQNLLKPTRAALYFNVKTNKLLDDNSYISCMNPLKVNLETIDSKVSTLNLSYHRKLIRWFAGYYDFENGATLDVKEINLQKENLGKNLNEDLANDTFVNIISETHTVGTNMIFPTEKTTKAIYTAQPFILFGNPNTLKYLKKWGYRTFSDFWDESYDDDVPMEERLNRLISTMEFIANKSWDELKNWLYDMEPILEHNFNVLMQLQPYRSRINNILKWQEQK